MLKFKFEKGRTLKAHESVVIYGKEEEGLNKAMDWMCEHLVVEEGQVLVRTYNSEGTRASLQKADDEKWVYGEIVITTEENPQEGSLAWKVTRLRNTANYALILTRPHLDFSYLL